jgi:hypothetical protein
MNVWTVESLTEFWCSVDFMEHCKAVPTKDVPRLLSDIIKLPSSHAPQFYRPKLSAYNSPLREDLFVIWAYIVSTPAELSYPKSTICKFCLFLPPAAPPQLHLRSSTCVEGKYPVFHDISYAGHAEVFDDINRIQRVLDLPELHRITNDRDGSIDLPDVGDFVHVSAYSGALTYATHYSVVVNYYQ